ncbi:origin recognition complex subunit 2 [Gloeophyllum trabeum ATCC 11539]|uniref:Origin recognition complex subunit 2 n=1 Tax=Gloeophyllum trabeum (strain ATCC 11539 / FP-39264 / Madison 617) TaxID=670483 RepID=S7RHB7_GLOTA|nr:origin recognition complex subunit 2 [Gloeophyllum trabeum ATCC 11539]EPQ53670.1 origin recognition complex subunit 2 [Gloeophyllum trabeum ATCC 11539]
MDFNSNEEDTVDQEMDFEDGVQSMASTPRKRRSRATASNDLETSHNIIADTMFDAFFVQASRSSRTSDHVFSHLVEPLSAEEYVSAIASLQKDKCDPGTRYTSRLSSQHPDYFSQYLRELDEGFNILFFGFGSKRDVLNRFAVDACSKRGHVVVVNAFQPSFTLKDILASIESIAGVTSSHLPSQTIDGQSRRICDYFSSKSKRPLYLIIHNIEAPSLRTAKARSCLSILCGCPAIRVAASVDHINVPLLWSSTESSTRKHASSSGVTHRGYAWLWHDLTTLAAHDFELSLSNRSSITGASSFTSSSSVRLQQDQLTNGVAMTETAAQHVLASVTEKAQKLFTLIATMQLKAIDEAGDAPTTADLQQFALSYDTLFNTARDNFIATNDTALRSLLGEFRDHGLVLSSTVGGPGGGEVLWIPLRKERLSKVVEALQTSP